MKYRIHIKADTDAKVKEELREAAEILTGLRETSKIWHDHFGHLNRINKEKWEKRADAWIEKHKVIYDDEKGTPNDIFSTNGNSKKLM